MCVSTRFFHANHWIQNSAAHQNPDRAERRGGRRRRHAAFFLHMAGQCFPRHVATGPLHLRRDCARLDISTRKQQRCQRVHQRLHDQRSLLGYNRFCRTSNVLRITLVRQQFRPQHCGKIHHSIRSWGLICICRGHAVGFSFVRLIHAAVDSESCTINERVVHSRECAYKLSTRTCPRAKRNEVQAV